MARRWPSRSVCPPSLVHPRCSRLHRLPSPSQQRLYSIELGYEQTQISTLPNGIRVATESTPGHFIGAGVYVDAGSRYESASLRGATHLTDRMAFKSTERRTTEEMALEIERLGGSFFASSGRDTLVYQATSYPHALESVLSVLSDTALAPRLLEAELAAERAAAAWEVAEIAKKPEYMIPELLHETAFPNNTLGLPLICPQDRISAITTDVLAQYRALFFKPERIVIAGVGVAHDDFLAAAEPHFAKFRASSPASTASASALTGLPGPTTVKSVFAKAFATAARSAPVDGVTGESLQTFEELVGARPVYRGGEVRLAQPADSSLAHVYIGFEAPSVHDPDLYAIACTHIMLGGGSSFSAGGPGKGMYSRLYTNVLNPHPEVDFCQAFHHTYADAGLFGIALAVTPEFAHRAPQIIAAQLDSVSRDVGGRSITEAQLRRAKNQLRSTMMYGLESRLLQVEDLGRQVQTTGCKKPWSEVWERIEALTVQDIHRAISRIIRPTEGGFSGKPTVVATGRIEHLGDVGEMLGRYAIGPAHRRAKPLW